MCLLAAAGAACVPLEMAATALAWTYASASVAIIHDCGIRALPERTP